MASGATRNDASAFHVPVGSRCSRHAYTEVDAISAAASEARDGSRNSRSARAPTTTGSTIRTAKGSMTGAFGCLAAPWYSAARPCPPAVRRTSSGASGLELLVQRDRRVEHLRYRAAGLRVFGGLLE